MKKIEIEFPCDFSSEKVGFIHLGRLIIGDSVCRLYLDHDGKMRLFCGYGAKDFIEFQDPPGDEPMLYGFGENK